MKSDEPKPTTPKLKLTYFDGPWLGEPIRSTFKIGGIAFEDERIAFDAFPALKPSLPFGSLPILTMDDGTVISQSGAILRYAGKLTGLYPECNIEAMKVDEAIGGIDDLFQEFSKAKSSKSEEDKKKIVDENIPRYAGGLDKLFAKNSDGPFVLGEKISIGDCKLDMVMGMVSFFGLPETCFDEFTHLLAASKAVKAKLSDI